jgi:hypothetical protein
MWRAWPVWLHFQEKLGFMWWWWKSNSNPYPKANSKTNPNSKANSRRSSTSEERRQGLLESMRQERWVLPGLLWTRKCMLPKGLGKRPSRMQKCKFP